MSRNMLYSTMNRMMLMDLIRVKNVNKQYKNGVTAIYLDFDSKNEETYIE